MSFPGGFTVKNLPASEGDARDAVLSVGREDPLEKETATQSSILAWKIPWTAEPGGPRGPWSRKESDRTERPCKLSWKY